MKIRVTGVLIKDGSILLLNQDVEESRSWSLPGGTVEEGETLQQALEREMKEETGLEVKIGDLLYVCDHISSERHVLHITFLITATGGKMGDITHGLDTNMIKQVAMVPINQLTDHGFSTKFQQLALDDFPKRGSYPGPKSSIGL